MRSMKLVGLAVAAVVALLVVGAASAFAGENPEFYVGSSPLSSSETIEAEANGTQVLKATGIEIDCTGVTAIGGVVKPGSPGTDTESLKYTGCTVKGHESECVAKTEGGSEPGVIQTQKLVSKLAFKTAKSAEEKSAASNGTVTVFEPEAGASEAFVKIELTGTNCGFVPETSTVKGSVVVTNVQATNTESSAKEVQELSAEGGEKYFTNPGAKETKAKLTAFGLSASYKGKSKVKLASKAAWWVFN